MNMSEPVKRTGSETKAEAQSVALELFITKGYEATSLREIAEHLGISKAALYYHFKSKEDIVKSIVSARGNEATELLAWARSQEPSPDLMERTVLRWVDSTSIDKLRGIRFMVANPATMRNMWEDSREIANGLEALATFVAGDKADGKRLLLVRMAFMSINSAVMAAGGMQRTDDEIVAAAREMAIALIRIVCES
ncbi:TetR/AcrR family transcriptional regulator [Cohnella mopanensis]|uniref:TetR/AcrR family transcriptional regulator n=1 Tax=Cohnella mopanensis TaxID=2911966 RepID=UPI001EF93907|nr:TetR/AcrR family transcriptional regulator [Cohnella mopanensis]